MKLKRRLLACFCACMLLCQTVPFAGALTGEVTRAADTLVTLGLVQGTDDGDYALNAPATRAQAAVLLVRLAGAEDAAKADPWFAGFTDLPAWCADAVDYAAHQGWVSGVTPVSFRPNEQITANAWCTFLLRMLGYDDGNGDFTVTDAARFAQRIGMVSGAYSGNLTRGDLFAIAKDVLSFRYKGKSESVASHLVSAGAVSSAVSNALGLTNPTLTARQISDRYSSAVFQVALYKTQKEIEEQTPSANGSGFFIQSDGVAVTNYHVISGAIAANITLSTGEVYPVESVLYYDAGIDIAVLQIGHTSAAGTTTSAFSYLELAGSQEIRMGDEVYALGNPLDSGIAISTGIISSTHQEVERYTLPCIMTTTDISQGSSGGALLNAYGQVIAITSGAYAYGNAMYLCVPVDPAMTADLSGEGTSLPALAILQAQADAAKAQASGK